MTKEWEVHTECGRNFIWSCPELERLYRELADAGYRAKHVEEYFAPEPTHATSYSPMHPLYTPTEFEQEVEAQEKQLEFNWELKQAIEGRQAG
jgi:hypothetical protein